MALSPGSRLGRYHIVRQLGAGAMGEVYLAVDPQIERRLALKTVRLDVQEQADDVTRTQMRLRFEREAKAAGRLVHPHIVTLFDAAEVDGVFFLAFEFVDGPNLGERTRQQPPLILADILRIAREAAAALDAAHRVGVVHRDIKPANLLLSAERGLKIADFGIARLAGQETHLTQTGFLIGTPQYLSPEQVGSDKPLDGRSDLFSLGVVLYELLAGRRPFDDSSMAALLFAIVMKEPISLGDLRPDLPPRLIAAVTRLLAKDPDQRFPTAEALDLELAAVERELAAPATAHAVQPQRDEPPAAPHAAPAPRRRGGIIAAAVASVVILSGVLALVGYQVFRPSPESNIRTASRAGLTGMAGSAKVLPPPAEPSPENPVETATTRPASEAGLEARIVGGVLTIRVSPSDAADRAVVKIDGLVRGLAAGSVMTLRPGRHEIEVVAEGFVSAKFPVDSRADAGAPTELEVRLERR